MYYYFGENSIIEQSNQMDRTCNDYPELTSEQILFYLANLTATASEFKNCQLDIVEVSLEETKQFKLLELQTIYENLVLSGYNDTTENIVLELTYEGRNAFNQLVTDLFVLNSVNDEFQTAIADINGIVRPITALNFKELMIRYATYYKAIWGNLVYK